MDIGLIKRTFNKKEKEYLKETLRENKGRNIQIIINYDIVDEMEDFSFTYFEGKICESGAICSTKGIYLRRPDGDEDKENPMQEVHLSVDELLEKEILIYGDSTI